MCPLCNKNHSYDRKFPWGNLDWPSTLLKTCPKYEALTPVQRGKKLEELEGCARCTSWKHKKEPGKKGCLRGNPMSYPVKESGRVCGKDHDKTVHGSGSKYCSAASILVSEVQHSPDCTDHLPVLLEIQEVMLPVDGQKAKTVMFFDNGSTTTLCTHSWAKKAGLVGEKVSYYLRVVGEDFTEHPALHVHHHRHQWQGSQHQSLWYGVHHRGGTSPRSVTVATALPRSTRGGLLHTCRCC